MPYIKKEFKTIKGKKIEDFLLEDISIDSKLYTPIDQGIVILKNAKENKEVKAFYDFILSKEAKKIFENYGYITK